MFFNLRLCFAPLGHRIKPHKMYKPTEQLQQQAHGSGDDEDTQASNNFNKITWKIDQVSTKPTSTSQLPEYNTKVTIRVQEQRLKVEVDSGVELNIMSYSTYRALKQRSLIVQHQWKIKTIWFKAPPSEGSFPNDSSSKWTASQHHLLCDGERIIFTNTWLIHSARSGHFENEREWASLASRQS